MHLKDQPPPTQPDRQAIWPLVIEDYTQLHKGLADELSVDALVITDMRERHALGIARYGTPLTAHNGRDQLVDAYQEALDLAVYLRAWLEENPEKTEPMGKFMRRRAVIMIYERHLNALWDLRWAMGMPEENATPAEDDKDA